MSEDYHAKAAEYAADTVRNFEDEILEQLIDAGEASDDLLNDYPNGDAWHYENHVNKWYNLSDAAELLRQLDEYEETDSGLWEGQQPAEAIGTCAASTFGNAVGDQWRELIEKINEDAHEIVRDFDLRIDDAEEDEDEADPDADTLREERHEALTALIKQVADAADPPAIVADPPANVTDPPSLLEAAELAIATIERLDKHGSACGTLDVLRVAIANAGGG